MQEKLLGYKNLAKEKWQGYDKGLKTRIIVITIGLIIIMGMMVYWSTRPDWVVLKSKSDEATIGKMQQIFTDAGIKNRIGDRATSIEVLQKDLNKAKIIIAESDIIDQKDFKWDDEVTSKIQIGMTENDKNKIYQNGDQKQIENLIKEFNNVINANVKLAIPENTSVFENNKNKVKAAITLETSAGFTRDNAVTIAKLVETSVPGLEAENITISDQSGKLLYSGTENGFSMSTKEEIEKNKYNEIEDKIENTLKPLFDEVKIISNLKFDWDKKRETNTTYTPPVDESTVGVPKTATEQSESLVNGTPGEEPGVASNDQTPPNYAINNSQTGNYEKNDKQTEYLYNTKEEVKEANIGTLVPEKSSISVVVYKQKIYDENILKKEKVLNKELSWDKFKAENAGEKPIEIDENLLTSIKVGTGIENVTVVGYEKPIFMDKVIEPVAFKEIIVLIILVVLIALLAFALIKKAQPDEIEEIEPEISIEDLIATNKREDEEVAEKLAGIIEVDSEYKYKIEDFIDENPEAVAQLLRNWLNEEWE